MSKLLDGKHFVALCHHDSWSGNKWSVWTPKRVFLCACEDRADAISIAAAMNRPPVEQAQLFSLHTDTLIPTK